jgi:hypothetical protein
MRIASKVRRELKQSPKGTMQKSELAYIRSKSPQ